MKKENKIQYSFIVLFFSHKKGGNPAIDHSVDETGEHYAK